MHGTCSIENGKSVTDTLAGTSLSDSCCPAGSSAGLGKQLTGMAWRYLWRTPGQKNEGVQGCLCFLPSPSSPPKLPESSWHFLGCGRRCQVSSKWVLPSTPVLRDPYKGILSSGAGQQGWAPDNLLEKSSLLAPPIPHHPPHSWSLPTEGAPESPSRVRYTALKNTWHSRSALATSLSGDSILLLIQPQIPFALCAAVGLLFLTLQPAKLLPVPSIIGSCCFPPPGLCRCYPGCLECSFPLLRQGPADPSIFLQVATRC